MNKALANFLIYGLSTGLKFVVNAAIFIVMARYLTTVDFGRITLAHTFGGLAIIIVSFGFANLMVREVAKEQKLASAHIVNGTFLMLLLTAAMFLVTSLLIALLKYNPQTALIVNIFLFFHLFNAYALFYSATFKGTMKFEYELYASAIPNLLLIGAVLLQLRLGTNVVLLSITFVLSRLVYLFTTVWFYLRHFGFPNIRAEFDLGFCRGIFKESWYFAIWGASSLLYTQVCIIILSYYAGERIIGQFQGAYRVIMASVFLLNILAEVAYPHLVAKLVQGREVFARGMGILNDIVLIIVLPMMLFFALFSQGILSTLYAHKVDLVAGWQVLSILAIAYFFYYCPPYSVAFSALGRQDICMKISVFTCLANLGLNVVLIPLYFAFGAAISLLVTFVFLRLLYLLAYLQFKLPIFNLDALLLALFSAALVVLLHVVAAPTLAATLALAALLASAVFLYCLRNRLFLVDFKRALFIRG